jgi:hypothetical protein
MAVLLRAEIGGQAWVLGVLVMVLRSGLGGGDAGLTVITYTVEPATPSAQALQFLSSWAEGRVPEASVEGT